MKLRFSTFNLMILILLLAVIRAEAVRIVHLRREVAEQKAEVRSARYENTLLRAETSVLKRHIEKLGMDSPK